MSDEANTLVSDYQFLWAAQGNFRALWNQAAQFVLPANDNFIGWFAEGVEERVRRPGWDRDARPCFDVDAVGPGCEPELALGDDKDLVVLVVHVLRRPRRAGRHGRLNEAQAVLGV